MVSELLGVFEGSAWLWPWDDDWHTFLAQILDEFLSEWAWADMMFKELWS